MRDRARASRRDLRSLPATDPATRPPSTEGLLRGSGVPIPLQYIKHMFDLSTREASAFDIFSPCARSPSPSTTRGSTTCDKFSDYPGDATSAFMTLALR